MNAEELGFVNQQLAGMLRHGIPLESALGQLCQSMRRGDLRTELEQLHQSLAAGIPFEQAITARRLPVFYIQMLRVGAKSNDLPGVLTLVADYYRNVDTIWTRLKGLMVYPLIVSVCSFVLSLWLAIFSSHIIRIGQQEIHDLLEGAALPAMTRFLIRYGGTLLWGPVVVIGITTVGLVVVGLAPRFRQRLRWRLPATRDASLWQLASTLAMLTGNGCPLSEALTLVRNLESDSAVAAELLTWQHRLADGHAKFDDLATKSRRIPSLFVWIVASSGDDLADGFRRAAEIYQARTTYLTESILQTVLPLSVVLLGSLIFVQAMTIAHIAMGNFLPLM